MSKIDDILKELEKLLHEGLKLQTKEKVEDITKLSIAYESWYIKTLSAISVLAPERIDDFKSAYKVDRRKEITFENYTISDYLINLIVTWRGEPTFNTTNAYQVKLLRQISILKAAIDIAPSKLRDIKLVLQAELFDNDLDAAKELFKKGHLRSAGVICGVVLETHLSSICKIHKISFRKKNLSIAEYNDALKNANVYDTPMWRYIQRLGDIRNLCAHSKEREPTKDEVQDLIIGTDKVLKEVF